MKNKMHKKVKRWMSFLIMLLMSICFACESALAAGEDTAGLGQAEEALEVPRIEITTEDGNGAALQKADGYVAAQIRITDTDRSVTSGSVQLKVRGNSTALASVQKKSFTFKYEKKTEVLGMGKGKKWALLANCFDPTLFRNYLVFDFAKELSLPYTSEQRIVELWLDGEYRGCYTVYEPVQEGKDRVDIDIESNDGKKDFLVEIESSRTEDDVTYLTCGGLRFGLKEPEEPTGDQLEYISGVMEGIIETLKSGDETEVREKIDAESFAAYYLLNEYAKTLDFGFSSVFFFYQDGKLYAGPPWDYDLSLGNSNGNLQSSRARAAAPSDGIIQDKQHLYKWLCNQEWFRQEIKCVYRKHYEYIDNIAADGGLLDTLRDRYAAVIGRNFGVWRVNRHWINYQKKPLATYEENYAFLKNWCAERNAWLTEYYDLFPDEIGLLGDANADGKVTILDATTIQRTLAMIKVERFLEKPADANEDGKVSVLDANAIQRFLAKMETHEGIGQKSV